MKDLYRKETHKESHYHYTAVFFYNFKTFMFRAVVQPSGYGELCNLSVMDGDGKWNVIADKWIVDAPYKNDYYPSKSDEDYRKMCEKCEVAFKEYVKAVYSN